MGSLEQPVQNQEQHEPQPPHNERQSNEPGLVSVRIWRWYVLPVFPVKQLPHVLTTTVVPVGEATADNQPEAGSNGIANEPVDHCNLSYLVEGPNLDMLPN